jgi:hypothetical protein
VSRAFRRDAAGGKSNLAPQVGLEPTAFRLTAAYLSLEYTCFLEYKGVIGALGACTAHNSAHNSAKCCDLRTLVISRWRIDPNPFLETWSWTERISWRRPA